MARISINFNDAKFSDVLEKFVARHPKPVDFNGTDDVWLKKKIVEWVRGEYRKQKIENAITVLNQVSDDDLAD